jgi:hypothetical protein
VFGLGVSCLFACTSPLRHLTDDHETWERGGRARSNSSASRLSGTKPSHVSGTTLSAQTRYAAGTREILEAFFAGEPIRPEYLIVEGGKLAGTGALSYQK